MTDLPRQLVKDLTTKHARRVIHVDSDRIAVQTWDGQWGLWKRESGGWAVRIADFVPPKEN